MWKCDKSKYLSNNGSIKNTFQTKLKESIKASSIVQGGVKLNNKMPFHRKIIIVFADTIGLITY